MKSGGESAAFKRRVAFVAVGEARARNSGSLISEKWHVAKR